MKEIGIQPILPRKFCLAKAGVEKGMEGNTEHGGFIAHDGDLRRSNP